MTKDREPLVTAWATCYNQAKYIAATLDSVRAQTYRNQELIVCDDCSSDGSQDVIRNWIADNWPEARFIEHKTNMGICKTLNEILAHAKGKYLAGVAGDDLWVPEKTALQVGILESCPPNVGVVFGDANLMDESGVPRAGQYFGGLLPIELRAEVESRVAIWPTGALRGESGVATELGISQLAMAELQAKRNRNGFFELLIRANVIPAMTAMVRKACFARVGAYDESLFFEDWDMWLRISRQFSFVFVGEPTARDRLHDGATSRMRKEEIRQSIEAMFRKYAKKNWLKNTGKEEDGEKCLKKNAIDLYAAGSKKRHAELLWLAWRYARREYWFLLFCSTMGLSYRGYMRLRDCLRRR